MRHAPTPLSLAIVCNAFPAGEQARALGIWAGISAVALGIGPLAGGALVDLDWRLIFWINLPIAALGIAIMALAAPESTDPGSGRRVDLAGLAALGAGLTAFVLALVQARVWSSTATVILALVGVGALYAFWRIEHRVAEPIVDFSLFRNGPYFGASAAAFALVGAYWAVMFFQSQYLQDVRGHSAVLSGLLILPVTVPMIFVSPFSGRLIARFGARRPRLRADVDRGDGGNAGGEGRHRLRRVGDGPRHGGNYRPRRYWGRLPRPARRRRFLCRLGRRLHLGPGRPLRRGDRADLDLRARFEPPRA
jgi:MFS family permease